MDFEVIWDNNKLGFQDEERWGFKNGGFGEGDEHMEC